MKTIELRTQKQVFDLVRLAEAHHIECAPHLPCDRDCILKSAMAIKDDVERNYTNLWLCYNKDGEAVGYGIGVRSDYFFNDDCSTKLELLYVAPAYRGTYAMLALVKVYEEWARLQGALQIYVGVARLDQDEAKKIRKLFPKLNYQWCGSYYLKETI